MTADLIRIISNVPLWAEPLTEKELDEIIEAPGRGTILVTSRAMIADHMRRVKTFTSMYSTAEKLLSRTDEEMESVRKLQLGMEGLLEILGKMNSREGPLYGAMWRSATLNKINKAMGIRAKWNEAFELMRMHKDKLLAEQLDFDQRIVALLESLVWLSEAVARFNRDNIDDGQERPKHTEVTDTVVGLWLPALYAHHFGRNFARSRSSVFPDRSASPSRLGGPAVRFLAASVRVLGIKKSTGSPYGNEGLIAIWKKMKTAESAG
jgi:hypothetical protein